ncbi:hypothetical protein BASA81_011289 [Batrachochytrium salamandrivorans]|nr:hypothetical protein BASA81_011289 [Batrachochytrium salamandrivorans]
MSVLLRNKLGVACPATRFDELGLYSPKHYRSKWRQLVLETFAGITMALGLVGESIAFSFLLHVGPLVALHATWITVLVVAVLGSRPGTANGADGVRAASLAPFVLDFGVGALFYAVLVIAGFFFLFAITKAYRLVKIIPHTAMVGFLNGLAIIIFKGQVEQLQVHNVGSNNTNQEIVWHSGPVLGWMFFEIILTMLLMFGLSKIPKIGEYIPGAIIAILTTTFFELIILRQTTEVQTPTIGTVGSIAGGFPQLFWKDPQYEGQIPIFTWDLFVSILWPSFSTACACFIEIVLIMEFVDDANQEQNRFPNRHIFAFGVANLVGGLMGTMGGASLLSTTILFRKTGASGEYQWPAFVTAGCLILFVAVLSEYIAFIPTSALIGVMTMICIYTFQWDSLIIMFVALLPLRVRKRFKFTSTMKIKRFDALVIAVVSILTPLVNLFVAVLAGVLLTSVFVVVNSGNQLHVSSVEHSDETTVTIHIEGQLNFASTARFSKKVLHVLAEGDKVTTVKIEFHKSTVAIQDYSALHTLNALGFKLKPRNQQLILVNLDVFSRKFVTRADSLRVHFAVQEDEPSSTKDNDDDDDEDGIL